MYHDHNSLRQDYLSGQIDKQALLDILEESGIDFHQHCGLPWSKDELWSCDNCSVDMCPNCLCTPDCETHYLCADCVSDTCPMCDIYDFCPECLDYECNGCYSADF